MISIISISVFLALLITALILKRSTPKNLPPSPWKLPIIGHIHHLFMAGGPPHHSLRKLARKYGSLMYLQMGEIPNVVVSSRELAEEIMKTQDLIFANRAEVLFGKIVMYNATDVLTAPYGDYWRRVRKICTMELLTARRVQSFGWIRHDEGLNLVKSIKHDNLIGKSVNLSHKIKSYNSSMVMRAALGDVSKDDHNAFLQLINDALSVASTFEISDLFPSLKLLHPFFSFKSKMVKVQRRLDQLLDSIIDRRSSVTGPVDRGEALIDVLLRVKESSEPQTPFTKDNVKAVLLDLFIGGTETSSTTVEWAMAELIRNPHIMAKVQDEIRMVFGKDRTTIQESEIQHLKYLKSVVKETFRLHPPGPLLLPRESRQETQINGYNIPIKTKVLINVWAIGRDPKCWEDPDSFKPERFENSDVDFIGNHFELLPFGAGRRMCPAVSFGMANVYLPLALILYHFNWELPDGQSPNDLDMTETISLTASRATDLVLQSKIVH